MPDWDKIDFDAGERRAKPEKHFYLISLPARELRSLSGIVRRVAKDAAPRTEDLGIQRQHDPERSEEIGRFVEFGFPWSTLSEAKRASAEFNDLRKPGWLPTAIVLNILTKGAERNGNTVADADLASIVQVNGQPHLQLPYQDWSSDWEPTQLPPFEVIDGQHRLWAFEGASKLENFQLPVVAFVGLDISWQAYLFWTINIKPKRINPSLAFDLYPLLRNEDWLDRAEGHMIYRETRAQELTEILWSYPESPWYDRINMLGERQNRWVTQSAWIKSLTASFIRSWDRRSGTSGGLFGGRSKNEGEVLGWSRAQQAAFLIFAWRKFASSVAASKDAWAEGLRRPSKVGGEKVQRPDDVKAGDDLAFFGAYSLITTDQGVRGFLHVINDLCYQRASALKLNTWRPDEQASANPIAAVEIALRSLEAQEFTNFVTSICNALASFDWRTSSTPDLEEPKRRAKLVFRGSGGYKELRTQLLEHLSSSGGDVGEASKRLLGRI
ncbi:DGQHR domain-containing protein [Sandarakinorhabdus oryzae]|uniref:DGQHR domain-containing protein n=1 Tax=Sandarakinorhabdus oryzae TaxID=2675220 RepID=UPI0018CC0726|nr:DGQHR domain-containing protein [Sandarakinorhabdus oryzae]